MFSITPHTVNKCRLFHLPNDVLIKIYEYDPTYYEKYRESIAEFDYIMKKEFIPKLCKEFYENCETYSSNSVMGQMIPPLYKDVPYFLPPLKHTQSNIFRAFDIYCLKYPYTERCKKREYITTITRFANKCQYCDSTDILPHRYKLKNPLNLYLFCSYTCHQTFFEDIDQKGYIKYKTYTHRPVFNKDNIGVMAKCNSPNYWVLNPETEQWEKKNVFVDK